MSTDNLLIKHDGKVLYCVLIEWNSVKTGELKVDEEYFHAIDRLDAIQQVCKRYANKMFRIVNIAPAIGVREKQDSEKLNRVYV